MRKHIVLFLIIILSVFNLILINIAVAVESKPSVPQFSLKIVDNYVQVDIQVQSVPDTQDVDDTLFSFRVKVHDATNWVNYSDTDASSNNNIVFGMSGTSGSTGYGVSINRIRTLLGRSDSFQVDFQIQTTYGYEYITPPSFAPPIGWEPTPQIIHGNETSGWSETQTITIPAVDYTPQIQIIGFFVIVALACAGSLIYVRKRIK
jgi:hypothetical protein